MGIDWFTFFAQIINFLILVWLLKRFLYQPILHAIDAREKRIAAELADADAKKAEAQKERDEFQHKNEEFDQQRAALLRQATDEARYSTRLSLASSDGWNRTPNRMTQRLTRAIVGMTKQAVSRATVTASRPWTTIGFSNSGRRTDRKKRTRRSPARAPEICWTRKCIG